jgi:hypothetical protein
MSSTEDPMRELLRSVASDRERILRDAEQGQPPAYERRVLDELGARLGVRRRRPYVHHVARLAAALLLIGMGTWLITIRTETFTRPEVELGHGAITPLSPIGQVPAFEEFRWQVTGTSHPRYVLVVESAMPGSEGAEVLRRSVSTERLRLTPAEISRLPTRITWRVTWLDSTGQPLDSASASSWR